MNVWINWFISFFTWSNIKTNGGNISKIVIKSESETESESESEMELINSYRLYNIMKIIKNAFPLDDEQLSFVKTLSREELIEIIEINNTKIYLFNKLNNFTEEENN